MDKDKDIFGRTHVPEGVGTYSYTGKQKPVEEEIAEDVDEEEMEAEPGAPETLVVDPQRDDISDTGIIRLRDIKRESDKAAEENTEETRTALARVTLGLRSFFKLKGHKSE